MLPDAIIHSTEAWVADQLRRRILNRDLEPGEKLRQAELAKEFGVSTTPVREALRSLAAEGLVEIDTHRGARIRSLRPDELVEVLELQMVIELSLASLAAANMTEDILDRAAELHAAMENVEDATEFSILNRDFHCTLASPSGRDRSLRLLTEMFNVGMIQLREDIATWAGRKDQGVCDHHELLDAMRARDVDIYRSIIQRHVEAAIGHLQATAS